MTREELEQAIENGESVWYPKNRTIKQIETHNRQWPNQRRFGNKGE